MVLSYAYVARETTCVQVKTELYLQQAHAVKIGGHVRSVSQKTATCQCSSR